jgi:hypothetical protein
LISGGKATVGRLRAMHFLYTSGVTLRRAGEPRNPSASPTCSPWAHRWRRR